MRPSGRGGTAVSVEYHKFCIRLNLLKGWRSIVDDYPDLNATIYEEFSMYADQIDSIGSVLQIKFNNFAHFYRSRNMDYSICSPFMHDTCVLRVYSEYQQYFMRHRQCV